MNTKAYIIAGPTASGKSDFAHALATQANGTIINCDSVQIYRGIESISASPFVSRDNFDEIDGIPYRLFSVLPLAKQISVSEYLEMARREYESVMGAGRTPIFVGGTGYYINALINGISPMPNISDESRTRARALVASDIVAARALLPADFVARDPQRVARALEVFFETGHHITEFQNMPRVGAVVPNAIRVLVSPDINELRHRIANRIPQMLSSGAMVEAKRIIDTGWDENRAIGASQLCKLIRGEISESECIQDWIIRTNQYAKRQRTWFRTQYLPDIIINHTPTLDDVAILLNSI